VRIVSTGPGDVPRILFFEGNPDGTVGGSYFSLLYLADGIDRSRYQPVVTFRREIPFLKRFHDAGLEVHIEPGHRAFQLPGVDAALTKRLVPLRAALQLVQAAINVVLFFLVSAPRWTMFLRRQRIRLVHANNSVTRSHDLMLGALLAGIPVITHERGINTQFSRLTAFVSRRLAAIICISEAVRTNLSSHAIGRDNLRVIFNAVDPSRVRPSRPAGEIRLAHGIEPDQPILVMLGNIRRWKGQEVVVRALAPVAAKFPRVVCLFVGEATEMDRPYERELHALVETLGLRRNVRFIGYQENVADFLNVADIAIHASVLPEPFGRVLLEAMAMRKPVVGSRGGAVPEIVIDRVTGRTFAEGSSDELAACLLDLLTDPAKAAAFGQAGYDRLTRVFSIRENVAKTEAIYESLLPRARVSGPAATVNA
jgi:glycosyltransferase involved in cell wall biosynthesis